MEKVLSLFLLVFLLPAGSAQQCFTEESCNGTSRTVSSVEECCLGDGISYDDGAGCMTCIVFGWLDGVRGIGPEDSVEQGQAITLEVGYLKGDDARSLNLRYDVMNIPGTAAFGANNDYTISNTQNLRPRPNRPVSVLLTLRVDNIALEGNETLSLVLMPLSAASGVRPGVTEFFLDTLNVTIIDQDIVGIQFTESDYRAREEEEAIRVVVERETRIARPVTVRIVPLNYSEFEELLNSSVVTRPADFPFSADDPSPDPVLRAKSVPEERRDFSVTPIEVTFGVDEFPSADIEQFIGITDDEINEADEVFVVILELVDTELSAHVDLEERGASLCRIVDNDPIRIGFERPTYTVPERRVRPFVDLIYIIKEDDRISEQDFELGIQAGAPAQGVASAATRGTIDDLDRNLTVDYTVFSPTGFIQDSFFPEEQRVRFDFTPFSDEIPESREAFQVSVGPTQRSAPFVNGQFPVTVVFIEDDDDVIIVFEQTSVTVPEDVGTFALCLNVSTEDLPDGLLPAGFDVFIDLDTTAGTAGPEDYTSVIDELQFTSETLQQCFTVTIIDDLLFETLETFNITALPQNPDDPVVIVPPTVTITILDNDPLCPDPADIANGMVTFTGNSVGDTATYTCDSGFELIGTATLTCTSVDVNTAVFSPAPPECRPLCPDPPPLVNGMVTFTGNSIGDTATYTCNSGFELIGSATATCGLVSGNANAAVFAPAPPVCRIAGECNRTTGLDLFFVLDSSESVNFVDSGNFMRLLESVRDIVGEFDIGLNFNQTRVGVIRFASGADLIFNLTEHTDLSSLQAAILAIPYVRGGTRTNEALDLLADSFNEENGARNLSLGIPRAAIVITDGLSENQGLTAMSAQSVCESAIIPFAAGIGATFTSNPNTIVPGMAELLAIACGNASRVEIAENFSTAALMELQENITEFGCGVEPMCPDPPPLENGMVIFTGNSIGDTATYACNTGFTLIGNITATCGQVSGIGTVFSPAPPECRPTSPDILVNDTIIGDPLFTVPLNVRNLSADISSERVSLCYEVHGAAGEYFNLVSDSCVSVNAHYAAVDLHFDVNIIDAITVRAVGSTRQCRNITVNLAGCSASVNGVDISMTYRSDDIYVRQYPHRVRISVPNCADQSLVMWVFCLNGTLEDPQSDSTYQVEMIRFVIARGFNLDETSHGLLGQFWNIPIDVRPYIGNLSDGTEAVDVFIVTVNYPNQEPRMFAGNLYPLTWEFEDRPCLYAGNGQGGPIDEVPDPNDPVIQGIYSDYQVNGPFETNFTYSHFDATRCT